jgi:hypothetical protein
MDFLAQLLADGFAAVVGPWLQNRAPLFYRVTSAPAVILAWLTTPLVIWGIYIFLQSHATLWLLFLGAFICVIWLAVAILLTVAFIHNRNAGRGSSA